MCDTMNRLPDNIVIYTGGPYVFYIKNGLPYLTFNGKTFALTCHPYEPCLYINGPEGERAAVHNSFDPLAAAEVFLEGRTLRSVTGREYGPEDFCRMVDYASGKGDMQIDDAERVFGSAQVKTGQLVKAADKEEPVPDAPATEGLVITDDPFYRLAAEYPDAAVEYCLVKNPHTGSGEQDHRAALSAAAGKLFRDEAGNKVWNGRPEKALGNPVDPEVLFAPLANDMNYRKAFRCPPWGNQYEDGDFDRVNAVLFPGGTAGLTVYEWTTGWSDYFDDGREWWGTLCLTVYDSRTDRFAVIMASATD